MDQTGDPQPDVLSDWEGNERSVRTRFSGYKRISLRRVDYRSYQAADWDYRWQSASRPVRVRNRNIRVNNQQAYALFFSGPESEFARSQELFAAFARTFQPAALRDRSRPCRPAATPAGDGHVCRRRRAISAGHSGLLRATLGLC